MKTHHDITVIIGLLTSIATAAHAGPPCASGHRPTRVDVDATINAARGEDLVNAFFGKAVVPNRPILINEDLDLDGALDVDEDIDGDGVLDPGEDVDGDGALDLDEDYNGNGALDEDLPYDTNGDGTVDASDNVTFTYFSVYASSIDTCETITAAMDLTDEWTLEPNATELFTDILQFAVGDDAPSGVKAGRTFTADDVRPYIYFGTMRDGEELPDSWGYDRDSMVMKIKRLGETADVKVTATLYGEDPEAPGTPITARYKNLRECEAVSAVLKSAVERRVDEMPPYFAELISAIAAE
jgi:hypothetical protein